MGTAVRTAGAGWSATWAAAVPDPVTPAPEAPTVERLEEMRGTDDAGLVRAFLAGTPEAFDVIVERHRRQIYQLCYRFLGNHEDASDMTQDVFVRAFKGLKNFKGDAALGTWLYRVGVNACLNRVSLKQPRMEELDHEQHVDHRQPDPHELVARDERAARVRRAIAQLPPKQRAALVLRMYQEMSHEEIAGTLGSSVGAVKANFFHALGNLKRLLEAES
jgi:RNA polymerase sigma-70 factor (ECF subfamily)